MPVEPNYRRFMQDPGGGTQGVTPAAAGMRKPSGSGRDITGQRGPLGGIYEFAARIYAEAHRREAAFEVRAAQEAGPQEEKRKYFARTREAFSRAAHAVTDPVAGVISRNSAYRAFVDNPVWKPFKAMPVVAHYIRHPFGQKGADQNWYTNKTVKIDFYLQAMGAVIAGQDGVINADAGAEDSIGVRKVTPNSYRSLNLALRIAGWSWDHGGRRLAKGVYHSLCCDKTPNGERHFSPLQVANSAALGVMLWGASYAVPIAASAVGFVATPFYMWATEYTYENMDIMDKSEEDNGAVLKVYAVNVDEHTKAQERRRAGEEIDDDEIGRRFDVEDNFYYGVTDPITIYGRIPKLGHCDEIHTVGWFFRTPKIRLGFYKIRAHVWLTPEIISTRGCKLIMPREGALESPAIARMLPVKVADVSLSQVKAPIVAERAAIGQKAFPRPPYNLQVTLGKAAIVAAPVRAPAAG